MEKGIMIEGFWDRLEDAIGESGMTKSEIARRVGCDRKTLYENFETHRMLHSGYLARICAVTKVSAAWLLGLRREK